MTRTQTTPPKSVSFKTLNPTVTWGFQEAHNSYTGGGRIRSQLPCQTLRVLVMKSFLDLTALNLRELEQENVYLHTKEPISTSSRTGAVRGALLKLGQEWKASPQGLR